MWIYVHGLVVHLLGFETARCLCYPAWNSHIYLVSLDRVRGQILWTLQGGHSGHFKVAILSM